MNETPPNTPLESERSSLHDLPEAVAVSRSKWRPQIVWLIPLLALLVGGWLAIKTAMNQGPTVVISFRTAEGLEAGKTRIKYKDVDIGVVRGISLSKDHSAVLVEAELSKQAEPFLVDDTRFWVVKPRIAGGSISGLGTLLSGAYIGVDAGKSQTERKRFEGLEVPPVLTAGLPGREFVLRSRDLGSVSYGTPVYYRRMEVGEVVAYNLDKDGQGVTVEVFIHSPYEKFVTTSSRFWFASGVDVSLDATGVKFSAESLASVLMGGIAFGTPPDAASAPPAAEKKNFTLHANRSDAYKREDTSVEHYVLVFRESVHGLQQGAPVEFRGIPIGEVTDIGVDFDAATRQVNVPVTVRLYPDRLLSRQRRNAGELSPLQRQKEIDAMIAGGLRGQLRTGSLITGQLYVALDFFPNVPKAKVNWADTPVELPTMSGGLQELQATVTSIASKIDKIPFQQIASDLRLALQSLDKTLKQTDQLVQRLDSDVAPSIKETLDDARKTLQAAEQTLSRDSPMQQDLRDTLREVSRAAESMRSLTDYLDRHPEALIRGKVLEDKP